MGWTGTWSTAPLGTARRPSTGAASWSASLRAGCYHYVLGLPGTGVLLQNRGLAGETVRLIPSARWRALVRREESAAGLPLARRRRNDSRPRPLATGSAPPVAVYSSRGAFTAPHGEQGQPSRRFTAPAGRPAPLVLRRRARPACILAADWCALPDTETWNFGTLGRRVPAPAVRRLPDRGRRAG